jgi:hypothetical protein
MKARVLVECRNAAFGTTTIHSDFRSRCSLCKLPFYLPMTNEDYPFGLETMFASTALELLTFKLAI